MSNKYMDKKYVECSNCGCESLRTSTGICIECGYNEFEIRNDYQDFISREVEAINEEV